MHKRSPGPVYGLPNLTGAINHDPSSKYSKSPAYTVSPRLETHHDNIGPGPNLHPGEGIYRTGKEGGRAIIIRGREEDSRPNPNPGPGQYDPQNAEPNIKPSKPAFSFGKKGQEPKFDNIPGPGNYETATSGNVKSFTMGGRPHSQNNIDSPGPADYIMNPKLYRQGQEGNKGFTMYGRSESSQGYAYPGPGSYEYDKSIEKTRKRVPAPGFGGKAKDIKFDNNPGPGSYSPSWGDNNKTFTMGGRDSGPKFLDTPGPGEYTINDGKGTCRTIRITGRPAENHRDNMPGPGAYSPEPVRKGNPAFSMHEKREYKYGEATPGPGSYNPLDRKSQNGFLIRGRPQDGAKSMTPGPGDYNIPEDVSNRGKQGGKGYKIKGRERSWSRDNNPGPGSYSPENSPRDKKKGPQWSFGDKTNTQGGNSNPGPGAYNLNDGKNNVKGFKIHDGKENRGFAVKDTPAPNQYDIDPNIGKKTPAFSLKGRGKDGNMDTTPGPGTYDPDPMIGRTVRSNKPTLPQFSLGAKRSYDYE